MEIDDALSDQVGAELAKLASGCRTAADVARKLADAGCTGERGSCDCCPVAAWLSARISPWPGSRLCVGIDNAEILTGHGADERVVAAAPVPQVIASFIIAFDDEGLYSNLARGAGPPWPP